MGSEEWVRFRYSDAFPASEPLGNWVACLALVANDLVQTNARLIELLETEGRDATEVLYYFWLSCSHYREAVKFLAETLDLSDVAALLESLPEVPKEFLDEIRKSYEPWAGSFAQRIAKPLRDRFFHYPRPDAPEWVDVWRGLRDKEGGLRRTGPEVKDARFIFADDVRVSLMAQHLGVSEEEVAENLRFLGDVVGKLAVFAQHVLTAYLTKLGPDKLVQGRPREMPSDKGNLKPA